MPVNKDEFGFTIRFDQNFDMSSNTALELTFTKPDDSTLVRTKGTTPAVTLGGSTISQSVEDIDTGETTTETFTINEYVEYIPATGEIDQAGVWTMRLKYTDATKELLTDAVARFDVLD